MRAALFHIDLNDQKPGRYDQDLRFGSESLKDKARRFAADQEIQALLHEVGARNGDALGAYSREKARHLKEQALDVDTLAKKGLAYERLDQLVVDLLLGAR